MLSLNSSLLPPGEDQGEGRQEEKRAVAPLTPALSEWENE
jgi:hypothetical protein